MLVVLPILILPVLLHVGDRIILNPVNLFTVLKSDRIFKFDVCGSVHLGNI
jgi:hypothetical protein